MRNGTTACGMSNARVDAHWNGNMTTCPACIASGRGQVLNFGEMQRVCDLIAAMAGRP